MNLIIAEKLINRNGSKYVLTMDGKEELIDDISLFNSESGSDEVINMSDVYTTREHLKQRSLKKRDQFDDNHVICVDYKYKPTENGTPENEIFVRLHWRGYKNKKGGDSTVEDLNCLAIKNSKPGKGTGKKRLSLDSNLLMTEVSCFLDEKIQENNIKVSSGFDWVEKMAVCYGRTSVKSDEKKKSDEKNSLDVQNDCNIVIAGKNRLLIKNRLEHNGKSGGGKGDTTPNTMCPLFQDLIKSPFNTLIVTFPHRLCRKVSVFLNIFLFLKTEDKNILSLISNPSHHGYGTTIDTSNDIELNKYSDKDISILRDRKNFYSNPLPDSLYMSLINKSIWMTEIHYAEVEWERISATAKRNADLRKKREHENENEIKNELSAKLKKLKAIIDSEDIEKIKNALSDFK